MGGAFRAGAALVALAAATLPFPFYQVRLLYLFVKHQGDHVTHFRKRGQAWQPNIKIKDYLNN